MAITIDQLVIFAARSGNIELLSARVRAGGDVNHFDRRHGTPLIAAIGAGQLRAVEWLVANGADVNADYGHQTGPLEIALRNPDPEMVGLLVRAGARLRRTARPFYAARREECLRALGLADAQRANESGDPDVHGGND